MRRGRAGGSSGSHRLLQRRRDIRAAGKQGVAAASSLCVGCSALAAVAGGASLGALAPEMQPGWKK
jgi:hypothetical protein